ncbi:MAG: B12-binding domain-containing radical SAM protein [Sporomusaceae bacterium]|nr:B12-binding domain-containing radical SAM protein [Sporomusaceae bacterium]
MNILLTTLNAKYIHSSLALLTLRQACREQILSPIRVEEYTINHSLLDIVSDIFAARPDVIALACYIWNWEMTKDLVSLLQKVLPEAKIILGGPEVSYDPKVIFAECAEADFVISGEGENALPALLQKLEERASNFSAIPGVTAREDAISAQPVAVADLDALRFPYEPGDMEPLKEKIIYYESSRGCPFSCQYCLSSASQGVRYRSLEKVLAEIDFFVANKVRQVKFVDRTFNAFEKHYFPILQHIKELETKTNFHFEIAVELLNDEIIEFLADMPKGRIQFEIGVQSTHEPTLAAIDRKNDWQEIVRKVTQLRSYNNMHLHLDLIIGLPFEDKKTFGRSFNHLYALQPHMLQLGFLKMLRGAKIHSHAIEHHYIWMDQAPYEVLANDVLPYEDVRQLKIFEEVFELYYNKGRFQATLTYMTLLAGDAFTFYENFSQWWEQQGFHKISHSTKQLYQHLLDYGRLYYEEKTLLLVQLLKFDALTNDQGKIRQEGLDWNERRFDKEITAFWRSEKAEQYVADFSFQTWRTLQKEFHIEVFTAAVKDFVTTGQLITRPTAYLFDYRQKDVLCCEIACEDFWLEETRL